MTPHHNSPLSDALGWAHGPVLAVANSDPGLALHLLTASHRRLHLLGFVLAVTQPATPDALLRDAISLPMREVLPRLGLPQTRGIHRLLSRIRGPVLEGSCYRQLASLISEPNTARVLFHEPEITPELLANLAALPIPMRTPVIARAVGHVPRAASHIVQWTAIISARLLTRSPKDIQETVGDSHSLTDLKSRLTKLLDALPALEGPPPRVIQNAVRVDSPSHVRQLGKHFMNCLDRFVTDEIDGSKHIYHWRNGSDEAVCEISRFGNLGWFLDSALGPQNAELQKDVSALIADEFRTADIHDIKVIETFDDFYHCIGRRDGGGVNDIGGFTARDRHRRLL